MSKVCVFLADGFEEVEGITIIDILRRGNVEVTTVSISLRPEVDGTHHIQVKADGLFDEIDYSDMDMLVLPGGGLGTQNLQGHEELALLLKDFYAKNKWIAAICAAPTVLANLGFLEGRRATCYPTCEAQLAGAKVVQDAVVQDDFIITSRGVGTAIDFGLKLVSILEGEDVANQLGKEIVYYN